MAAAVVDPVGTFRCYRSINFTPERLVLIEAAARVAEDYERRGLPMTLRQLYYQLVSRQAIENSDKSYDRLGSAVSDGRMAGLISWTAIEDRVRNLMGLNFYDGPAQAVRSLVNNYRVDMWANQDVRPEVWVEKDALIGVLGTICNELRVNFFACKGYTSQSEIWNAGRRMARYVRKGQRPVLLHLGDHDPSGIDMTRDNQARLSLFAGVEVQVIRLALNFSQVEQLGLPPNPAKMSDSRYGNYRSLYGEESWELDALPVEEVQRLIGDAVLRLRDHGKWDEMLQVEAEDRRVLEEVAEQLGTPEEQD